MGGASHSPPDSHLALTPDENLHSLIFDVAEYWFDDDFAASINSLARLALHAAVIIDDRFQIFRFRKMNRLLCKALERALVLHRAFQTSSLGKPYTNAAVWMSIFY